MEGSWGCRTSGRGCTTSVGGSGSRRFKMPGSTVTVSGDTIGVAISLSDGPLATFAAGLDDAERIEVATTGVRHGFNAARRLRLGYEVDFVRDAFDSTAKELIASLSERQQR